MSETVKKRTPKLSREGMYQIIRSPLITEKATQLAAHGSARYEISQAKLFGSEALQRATNTAMQMMGGYGYVTEFDMERFWREARILTVTAGTSQIQRNMLARMMELTDSSEG